MISRCRSDSREGRSTHTQSSLDLLFIHAVNTRQLRLVRDDRPRYLADRCSQAVGDGQSLHLLDTLTLFQSDLGIIGAFEVRLGAEDFDASTIQCSTDSREHTAAAYRGNNSVESTLARDSKTRVFGDEIDSLLLELQSLRALPEHDIWVVVWWDESCSGLFDDICHDSFTLVACGAGKDYNGTVRLGPCDLGWRGNRRHHNVGRYAMCFGSQSQSLSVVAWEIIMSSLPYQRLGRHTTTVRCDTGLPHTLDAFLLDQSAQGMESSPSLEGADFLLVLAFEEQLDFRLGCRRGSIALDFARVRCWLAGYIRPGTWAAFGSRRRCDQVYCLTGDCGCTMNVLLDSLVGSLYR